MASEPRALLVAEGSGGHLIPALELANALARAGVRSRVWYARRRGTGALADALIRDVEPSVELEPLPVADAHQGLGRFGQFHQLWRRSQQCLEAYAPQAVVGFGGWVSAPVLLAARSSRSRAIRCMLHEQNVVLGRANRWLARWVDQIALSWPETQQALGRPARVTGMPVRASIGRVSRLHAAEQFGVSAHPPTLLVLGGSQGARAINHIMTKAAAHWSAQERQSWQVLHITGASDEAAVTRAYAAQQVRAWVRPYCADMAAAYGQADVVVARAGASTIAELARCGKPAILIPYPYAGGHQRINAQMVESSGGGLILEEGSATPSRLAGLLRCVIHDERLRAMMGAQMRALEIPKATERLAQTVLELIGGTPDAVCIDASTPSTLDGRMAQHVH